MGRLVGKVAIVTGGAQGLGATYAKALAAEGAKVTIADILDGGTLAADLQKSGAGALFLKTDITDENAVGAMVAETLKGFGRIDILVNNAAVFATLEPKPFEQIPLAEWDRVMLVNVRGSFQCAVAVLPQMRKQRSGKIINISSGTVFRGIPKMAHYVTSKGAILAMTRALAREVGGDGICVNTLAPGLTASDGIVGTQHWNEMREIILNARSLKRDEQPEDLIGALIFLASRDSDFMTGQCLVVDGGLIAH
jgi:NAD(P)-dependent dehydrogenase (short-subunit alcohol dehydrogenase family)